MLFKNLFNLYHPTSIALACTFGLNPTGHFVASFRKFAFGAASNRLTASEAKYEKQRTTCTADHQRQFFKHLDEMASYLDRSETIDGIFWSDLNLYLKRKHPEYFRISSAIHKNILDIMNLPEVDSKVRQVPSKSGVNERVQYTRDIASDLFTLCQKMGAVYLTFLKDRVDLSRPSNTMNPLPSLADLQADEIDQYAID